MMSQRRNQGFSLVEMLVAMAVTAILVAFILQLMSYILGSVERQKGNLRVNIDGRAALELLASDLRSAVIRPQLSPAGAVWFHKENDSANSSTQTAPAFLLNAKPAWLMFSCIPTDRDTSSTTSGDICAISYRLGYADPIASDTSSSTFKMMGLYRSVVTAQKTFASFINIKNFDPETYWTANSTMPSTDFLIGHVVDFQVAGRAMNPDGVTPVNIPATSPIVIANDANGNFLTVNPTPSTMISGAKLNSLDISLTLIDENSYNRLNRNLSAAVNTQIIQKNSRIYLRRVDVQY